MLHANYIYGIIRFCYDSGFSPSLSCLKYFSLSLTHFSPAKGANELCCCRFHLMFQTHLYEPIYKLKSLGFSSSDESRFPSILRVIYDNNVDNGEEYFFLLDEWTELHVALRILCELFHVHASIHSLTNFFLIAFSQTEEENIWKTQFILWAEKVCQPFFFFFFLVTFSRNDEHKGMLEIHELHVTCKRVMKIRKTMI